jgi:hypothetical protein
LLSGAFSSDAMACGFAAPSAYSLFRFWALIDHRRYVNPWVEPPLWGEPLIGLKEPVQPVSQPAPKQVWGLKLFWLTEEHPIAAGRLFITMSHEK